MRLRSHLIHEERRQWCHPDGGAEQPVHAYIGISADWAGEVGVDRCSKPVVVPVFLRLLSRAEVLGWHHAPVPAKGNDECCYLHVTAPSAVQRRSQSLRPGQRWHPSECPLPMVEKSFPGGSNNATLSIVSRMRWSRSTYLKRCSHLVLRMRKSLLK